MENGDDNQMHANEGDRALWFEELRRQEELEEQAAGNEAEDNARRQHRWAEQQRYRRLERATHEMCSPRTIKKAIAENREANLIETQRIVDQKNQVTYDEETNESDNGIIFSSPSTSEGWYYQHVLEWHHTSFRCRPRAVKYGNCPECFHCYPIGYECLLNDCPGRRNQETLATTCYFLLTKDRAPSGSKPNSPPVSDPHELSIAVMTSGHYCQAVTDADYLTQSEGYDPDDESLFSVLDISCYFKAVSYEQKERRSSFEDNTAYVLNMSKEDVQRAVDQNERTWGLEEYVEGYRMTRLHGAQYA